MILHLSDTLPSYSTISPSEIPIIDSLGVKIIISLSEILLVGIINQPPQVNLENLPAVSESPRDIRFSCHFSHLFVPGEPNFPSVDWMKGNSTNPFDQAVVYFGYRHVLVLNPLGCSSFPFQNSLAYISFTKQKPVLCTHR